MSKILVDNKNLNSLADDLAALGRQMVSISKKMQNVASSPKVKEVKITPEADPEMFSKEFISNVKKACKEYEKGECVDYMEFRKTLDID